MILLDTHVVVWLAEAPEILSATATEAIKEERRHGILAISDMTLLELARTILGQKIKVRTSLALFLAEVEKSFLVLPVTGAIAELSILFSPAYPKDPVDRVIGATALAHSCGLVTRDQLIRRSGEVPVIW